MRAGLVEGVHAEGGEELVVVVLAGVGGGEEFFAGEDGVGAGEEA